MMAERPAPDRRRLAWPQGAHPHPHPKPQGKPNPGRSGFGPWAAACSLGLSHPHRRRWPSHYCDCPLLPQRTSRVAEELGGGGLWEPGLELSGTLRHSVSFIALEAFMEAWLGVLRLQVPIL